MRLLRDTIRVEESAFFRCRLSLHRLPEKRGCAYVVWGTMPRKDLVVTKGEPRKIAHANRIRCFAACCGSHLFFEGNKDSKMIDVTIASLDDPTPFAPTQVIFLEDKLPWVVIGKSLPSLQKTPKTGYS